MAGRCERGPTLKEGPLMTAVPSASSFSERINTRQPVSLRSSLSRDALSSISMRSTNLPNCGSRRLRVRQASPQGLLVEDVSLMIGGEWWATHLDGLLLVLVGLDDAAQLIGGALDLKERTFEKSGE